MANLLDEHQTKLNGGKISRTIITNDQTGSQSVGLERLTVSNTHDHINCASTDSFDVKNGP